MHEPNADHPHEHGRVGQMSKTSTRDDFDHFWSQRQKKSGRFGGIRSGSTEIADARYRYQEGFHPLAKCETDWQTFT
jgi:hypothetical protein